MNTMQLLDQNVFWTAAGGTRIQLANMDTTHRANALAMLRRRAEYMHMMYRLDEENVYLRAPDDVYNEWLARSSMSLREDARAWLERRPLVMELTRLVRIDEDAERTVNGEVVETRRAIGTKLHESVEQYVKELEK